MDRCPGGGAEGRRVEGAAGHARMRSGRGPGRPALRVISSAGAAPVLGPGLGAGTMLWPGLTSTAWPSSRSKPTTHTQCSQAEKPSQRSRPRPWPSSSSSSSRTAPAATTAGTLRSSAAATASSDGPRELAPEWARPRSAIRHPLAIRTAFTADRAAERARLRAGAATAGAAASAGDGLGPGGAGAHVTLGAGFCAGPPVPLRGRGDVTLGLTGTVKPAWGSLS